MLSTDSSGENLIYLILFVGNFYLIKNCLDGIFVGESDSRELFRALNRK